MGRFTVFLDTNSIIANSYKIDSSPIINHFSKSELIEFVLSQVVIDEVIKNHQKEQNRVLADLEKLRREGSRYGVKILRHIGQTNVAEELNKTLIQLKVNVIDIHQAELNLIYQKAFELRKPFKNKNEKESGGIKDAIIWSSFLS
ncbi:PIN domain-containing protein, partial [Paenibacillus sp. MAEPY2]|uniref:PIN domain-containing protein n=2 Tax=unclassified Paenibacillus TaxID=185978 RepID=UPI00052BBBE0